MYVFFFFKQKTAYEMCGRDWSSDVCSSDLSELCLSGLVYQGTVSALQSPSVPLCTPYPTPLYTVEMYHSSLLSLQDRARPRKQAQIFMIAVKVR